MSFRKKFMRKYILNNGNLKTSTHRITNHKFCERKYVLLTSKVIKKYPVETTKNKQVN